MTNRVWITAGVLALTGVAAVQIHTTRTLRSELAQVREQLKSQATDSPRTNEREASVFSGLSHEVTRASSGDAPMEARLLALETAIANWQQAADYLMNRGQLPLTAAKAESLKLQFLDGSASDRDRLSALRLLRRQGDLPPEIVPAAVAWLQSNPNPDTTRALLDGLAGIAEPALFDPLYRLAASADTDQAVRERAFRNLLAFKDHPAVNELLWTAATTESNGNLRRRAQEALLQQPMNEQRLALLRQHGLDATASLGDRTLSLRALQNAKVDFTDVATALAGSAQSVADKDQLLAYLRTFDDVNHPAFLPTVVSGVQSQDPEIRVRATDALRDYRTDPTALQWLQYLAESDPDPRVRSEAQRAFQTNQPRAGGGGNRGQP